MATATVGNRCVKCGKPNAITKCGGCTGDFCYNHFLEHRQELNKQLDEIEINHDLIRQSINEQSTEPQKHSLMKQVDQWEKDSIKKIQQTAEETRKVLLEYTSKHISRIEWKLNNLTDRLKQGREENDFVETNLIEWSKLLTQLKEELQKPTDVKIVYESTPFITEIYADVPPVQLSIPNVNGNARWMQDGITVAGGNGQGNGVNQLHYPWGVYIDYNRTVYVADQYNHRIMEWKKGATIGQVVAGGDGPVNQNDQLNRPVSVLVDIKDGSLVICDRGNKRVVRWSRQNSTNGRTIIPNVDCWSLIIDNNGYLYVPDISKHEVRRYERGDTKGTVIAGGNGVGGRLDQLNTPYFIFVDQDHSVYVSDNGNHRVVKWVKGAKQGIVVAGGQDEGNDLAQLSNPFGIIVDQLGTVYVVDSGNYRVMRWSRGASEGTVVIGGNGSGGRANQFNYPCSLSFDRQNNIYVVDNVNHRVQKFCIEWNSTMC